LDPVNHLGVARPDQFGKLLFQQRKNMRKNMLALFDEQIDQDAPPLFTLPLKPLLNLILNPLIEPCDKIHGAFMRFSISFLSIH
jgi:hypothetical protein